MKKIMRIIAVGTLGGILLTIAMLFTPITNAEARTWPDNPANWSQEDWNEFWHYYYGAAIPNQYNSGPIWDGSHYCYFNGTNWYYIAEDGCAYYCNPPQGYNNNGTPVQQQPIAPTTNNTGYAGYNYYGGILNVYDGATEGQAQILAKIIYLYGHGVASQTAQACVGWSVMNSIDASSGGVDIGSIAPNFHYDSSKPTTDDFGRDLMPLARDIIFRWKAGRAGVSNNGRVLPQGYCWVWSTGSVVTFRNVPNEGGAAWNYSWGTPYGN